jgi:hypothetical protein
MTHEDIQAAIAKSEIDWQRIAGRAEVVRSVVHGDRVFLYAHRRRLAATYRITCSGRRVEVKRE